MLLWMVWAAVALPASGRDLAPELARNEPAWRLLGSGEMRWFGLRLYEAELWVGGTRYDPEAPFALRLRYARDIAGARLAQLSIDEMRRAGGRNEAHLVRWQLRLDQLFPDVRAGDTLTGLRGADGQARFFRNGEAIGVLEEPELVRAFFDIWLAPGTREPALRRQLLGLAEGAPG